MQHFLQLRLGSHKCQLYLAVLLRGSMLAGLVGCAHTAVVWLTHMECTWILKCPALHTLRKQYAAFLSTDTDTTGSCFAQQDHMLVFNFVVLP